MVQGDPDAPLHAKIGVDEETRESIRDSALTKALSKAMAHTPELFGDSPPEKTINGKRK